MGALHIMQSGLATPPKRLLLASSSDSERSSMCQTAPDVTLFRSEDVVGFGPLVGDHYVPTGSTDEQKESRNRIDESAENKDTFGPRSGDGNKQGESKNGLSRLFGACCQ